MKITNMDIAAEAGVSEGAVRKAAVRGQIDGTLGSILDFVTLQRVKQFGLDGILPLPEKAELHYEPTNWVQNLEHRIN